MGLGANTHRALILRVVLGFLAGVPAAGLALLHLGWASPFGLVAAVPAGYLLYAAGNDGLALGRHRPPAARPRFAWFLIAGVLCVAYWSTTFWA